MELKGVLTYEAEGNAIPGSRYYSRTAHVPSDSSGVTIGRGYDMRYRATAQIRSELIQAGVPAWAAQIFSQASGLHGKHARDFIRQRDLITLSEAQETKLYNLTYSQIENDTARIVNKDDVVAKYGATNWEELNDSIKELLIDLRFRGDYTPDSRRLIQQSVSSNDLDSFSEVMKDRENWPDVPQDRFERRARFLSR